REIRALGQVEHPHLVKIFTSAADGDHWFYAMELIEGAPLSAVCEQLQARTGSASDIDTELWRATLSSACEECRRQEKPLSRDAAAPAPRTEAAPRHNTTTPGRTGRRYVEQVVELV